MTDELNRMRERAGIVEMATNDGTKVIQIISQALKAAGLTPQGFPSMGGSIMHVTTQSGTMVTISITEEHP